MGKEQREPTEPMTEGGTSASKPATAGEAAAAEHIAGQLYSGELPVADVKNLRKLRPYELIRRKLVETRLRIEENAKALENEIKSDIPTYAETILSLVTLRPLSHAFSLAASTCAMTITYLFYLKRQMLMDEYLEAFAILEKYNQLKDAGDEDSAWLFIEDKVRRSGLLFEGVDKAITLKDFNFEAHRAYAANLRAALHQRSFSGRVEAVSEYLQKPPAEHLAILSGLTRATPGFLTRTCSEIAYNFRNPYKGVEAAREGLKSSWAVARDFEFTSNRPRAGIRLNSPHPAIRDHDFNIRSSDLSPEAAEIIIQSRQNMVSKEKMTGDLKRIALAHALNCAYTGFNICQTIRNTICLDTSSLLSFTASVAAIANNVLAVNLVMQPLVNSKDEVKHGRATVDSMRSQLAELYRSFSETTKPEPSPH